LDEELDRYCAGDARRRVAAEPLSEIGAYDPVDIAIDAVVGSITAVRAFANMVIFIPPVALWACSDVHEAEARCARAAAGHALWANGFDLAPNKM